MNFNIEATNWDNERRVKRAKIIADEIIKSIQIEEQNRALEFGCGTGLVSFNLIDKLKKLLDELGFKSVVTNIFYNDFKIIEGSKINYSLFLMIGKK